MNVPSARWLTVAVQATLVLLISLVFQNNLFGIAPQAFFETFQLNGQARVLGPMIAREAGLPTERAHLGKVYPRQAGGLPPDEQVSARETHRIFAQGATPSEPLGFEPYHAQFGLQAMAYGALHRAFGLNLRGLQLVSSLLFATALVILCALYRRIYGSLFATLFLACIALSPWMIAMARNLYWSPVLFLLPSVAAALLFLESRRKIRFGLYLAIFAAMTAKCLSNYEYITSITLLACSVFLVGPFFRGAKAARPDLRTAAAVFATCVLGFCFAFLVHAQSRAGDVVAGAQQIYEQDVKRRTYGDPSRFADETAQSLSVSPLAVLRIYTLEWPGKRQMILAGKLFDALLVFAVCGIAVRLLLRDPAGPRDLMMFITFLAVPVSWFVLAKGHSFTQTHINFVLWYLGFLPALFYVCLQTAMFLPRRLAASRN